MADGGRIRVVASLVGLTLGVTDRRVLMVNRRPVVRGHHPDGLAR